MSRKVIILFLFAILMVGKGFAEEGGVPLHGFADIIGGSSTPNTPETQRLNGFGMGNIDFYLAPEYSDKKIKSLFEIAIEPSKEDGSMSVDAERVQLGYALNDHNTLWVGRFHTPFGAWNTAYHHGGQLQPTVYRPRFIDFEDAGGIIPAHSVGIWLHGDTSMSESYKFTYDVIAANGPRITGNGTNPTTLDYNINKADRSGGLLGFNLGYLITAGSLDGLKVGVHAFTSPVNAYNDAVYGSIPVNSTNVQITGAYLFYDGDKIEVDAEIYQLNDTDATTPSSSAQWQNSMSFVQVATPMGNWRPFFMYENTSLNKSDNYINSQSNAMSYTRATVGMRYDVSAEACVKLQWMDTVEAWPSNINYDTLVAQYAVRF